MLLFILGDLNSGIHFVEQELFNNDIHINDFFKCHLLLTLFLKTTIATKKQSEVKCSQERINYI